MNVEKFLFNIPSQKIKFGLSRTESLLKACNNPEKKVLSIQIVGTNGKGSVSTLLAKALVDKGYKVGLYTSPHLVHFTERIRINFNKIKQNEIEKFINIFKEDIEKIKPSFFEVMTVLALWHFKQEGVDIAILETGLGGRLDSVTACDNKYVLFTSISLDHTDILGNTIEEIAREKAGAIINNQQICIGVNQSKIVNTILEEGAKKTNNKIKFITNPPEAVKKISFKYLEGTHQKTNAFLAYQTIKELEKTLNMQIDSSQIIDSFRKTVWPGRFQTICNKPKIIYDVAHNKEGLEAFINTFVGLKFKKRKVLILGFEQNKQIKMQIKKFNLIFDLIICTETNIRKSMPASEIFQTLNSKKALIIKDANKALEYAFHKLSNETIISIVGSHFFAPFINNYYQNCFAIDK
jgi:dihydrofolate synthase/folylpolyglutamate synthase